MYAVLIIISEKNNKKLFFTFPTSVADSSDG